MQGYDSFLDRELEAHILSKENYSDEVVSDLVDTLIDSGEVTINGRTITMEGVDEIIIESDDFLYDYFVLDVADKQNEKLELLANARILQANKLVLEYLG